MTKDEAEKKVRYFCHDWAKGLSTEQLKHPSFTVFRSWLISHGYSDCLNFRSRAGPLYDAELWFDQELNITWMR
jgi:hypothetical protein